MYDKLYHVYILTNSRHTVLYTGFTGDIVKRIWEHKHNVVAGFTRHYNVDKLIYFETFDNPEIAILREKQIKKYSRQKKETLINQTNPDWTELTVE